MQSTQSLARIGWLALVCMTPALMGAAVATHYLADQFDYQPALGAAAFHLGATAY